MHWGVIKISIVNLGSIKHPPKVVYDGNVSVLWPDSSLRFTATGILDIPVELNVNKTYVVALRSIKGNVNIEGQNVTVDVMNIATDNYGSSLKVFGGGKFTDQTDFAFAVMIPQPKGDAYSISVSKSKDATVASLFRIRVIEL